MHLQGYTGWELAWIGLSVFVMGMNKGGFPAGTVALPLLILVWPGEGNAAREAVSFMLPLLCVMDIVALAFYRRHILWRNITPLFPGMLAGIALASALFVSGETGVVAVSDRALKICIGALGLVFVVHQAIRNRISRRLDADPPAGPWKAALFGVTSGITSTLAHAAGPVMNMYLLPQKLTKMNFAATTAAFFFVMNLVKMVPFAAMGRIHQENLALAAWMLPIMPAGVAAGYGLVRILRQKYYIGLIYAVLLITSLTLIFKAAR